MPVWLPLHMDISTCAEMLCSTMFFILQLRWKAPFLLTFAVDLSLGYVLVRLHPRRPSLRTLAFVLRGMRILYLEHLCYFPLRYVLMEIKDVGDNPPEPQAAHVHRVGLALASDTSPRRIKVSRKSGVSVISSYRTIFTSNSSYTMKFTAIATLVFAFALPAFAAPADLTWDPVYGNPYGSLSNVSCSNGGNGLLTKGYTNFASLPSFPNIGGIPGATWNSALCGSCWSLTYTASSGIHTTIYITAVDSAVTYNVSPQAWTKLTNGVSFATGKVAVEATQVAAINCGM
ncbi:Cerato-platanin-domain-containing protein [Suillus ampliporus]|nr:Cerato-platanin-domain-containing protein [Suillus ampliporus]